MKRTITKKDFWIILGIVLAIAVAFITTFTLLYSCDNNNNKDDDIKKTVSVDEIPSHWEYYVPTLKLNKKDGKDFYWSQIGFVQAIFHIEVGSQRINPKLKYIGSVGEIKTTDYKSDAKISVTAVADYAATPYGGYNIESIEFDAYNYDTCQIYSTQSIKDITSNSFNLVLEMIGIIYVDGTKEISKDYTGSQISENFDFEIGLIGYDIESNTKIPKISFEIKDVEVSFYDYGIYISWKLTSIWKGKFTCLEVRFMDNTNIEQYDEYDFPVCNNNIRGTAIRGDFSYQNLPIEVKFIASLTNGGLEFEQTVVVTDFEIVNNV